MKIKLINVTGEIDLPLSGDNTTANLAWWRDSYEAAVLAKQANGEQRTDIDVFDGNYFVTIPTLPNRFALKRIARLSGGWILIARRESSRGWFYEACGEGSTIADAMAALIGNCSLRNKKAQRD